MLVTQPFTTKISLVIPYYLPYIAYTSSSENLLLDHVMIPQLIFFNILITCLLDIVLIM